MLNNLIVQTLLAVLLTGCSMKYVNTKDQTVTLGLMKCTHEHNSSNIAKVHHTYVGVNLDFKEGFSSTLGYKDEERIWIREEK